MTDVMMSLRALVEKSPDADVLREMIGFGIPPLEAALSVIVVLTSFAAG